MATVKEIAEAAGCSPSTVSIVLGGKSQARSISEATQKRVLDAAARLGYQPNIAARSLRGGASTGELLIAMFWAQDFRAGMMIRFWDGLRSAVERAHQNIRLVIYPYNNGELEQVAALRSPNEFHGAIICNAAQSDLDFLAATRLPVPVVLYNRMCDGYTSVNVDDRRMGQAAAEAMRKSGSSHIAILTGPAAFEGMNVRIQGVLELFPKAELHYCENSCGGGREKIQELLTADWQQALPDGLFCGSAMIAHGAIRAFKEAGVSRLPRIVAIGNGTADQDTCSVPSLSVVLMPMEDMAQECLRLLLEHMAASDREPEQIFLDTTYIARESCP